MKVEGNRKPEDGRVGGDRGSHIVGHLQTELEHGPVTTRAERSQQERNSHARQCLRQGAAAPSIIWGLRIWSHDYSNKTWTVRRLDDRA
jgi:hypothetical protein